MDYVTLPEVARLADVSSPSVAKHFPGKPGRGNHRILTYRDALRAGVLASLSKKGASEAALEKVDTFLRDADVLARVEAGQKYLAVCDDQACLGTEESVFKYEGGKRFAYLIVVNLQDCLAKLKAVRDQRQHS